MIAQRAPPDDGPEHEQGKSTRNVTYLRPLPRDSMANGRTKYLHGGRVMEMRREHSICGIGGGIGICSRQAKVVSRLHGTELVRG